MSYLLPPRSRAIMLVTESSCIAVNVTFDSLVCNS
jgi:hypothetical protein